MVAIPPDYVVLIPGAVILTEEVIQDQRLVGILEVVTIYNPLHGVAQRLPFIPIHSQLRFEEFECCSGFYVRGGVFDVLEHRFDLRLLYRQ